MTPTPTQVREWIEDSVGFYDGVEEAMPDAFRGLLAAARAWLDLFTECAECQPPGSGQVGRYAGPEGLEQLDVFPCPACAGRGYTLQPERLEAAAQGFYAADDCYRDTWESQPEEGVRGWYRLMARAAILAYLGEPR